MEKQKFWSNNNDFEDSFNEIKTVERTISNKSPSEH